MHGCQPLYIEEQYDQDQAAKNTVEFFSHALPLPFSADLLLQQNPFAADVTAFPD